MKAAAEAATYILIGFLVGIGIALGQDFVRIIGS